MKISPKLMAIIATLLILVAGGYIWWSIRSSDITRINMKPFVGVGEVLADQVAQTIHDRGRIVAVIAAAQQLPGSPSQTEWDTFQKELKKHPNITIATTEVVAPDPDDLEPGMGCPVSAFKKLTTQHSQADAIVFFIGLPRWQWLKEKEAIPASGGAKIIVLDSLTMQPKALYEPHLANGAVSVLVFRWTADDNPVVNPKTPREWFDRNYRIVTSQNYQTLPINDLTFK